DILPTNKNPAFSLSVSAILLAAALGLKRAQRWGEYWRIAFAFFIASVAYPFSAVFDGWTRAVLDWFAVTTDTSPGQAIAKVCEMLLKVVPILALVKLSGADFGSVYLKRGNLKLGAGIGLLVFLFLAPAAFMFAAQRFTSTDALVAAVVWGLVFAVTNGFMEELWVRGLFLKHCGAVIGVSGSVWLTSIIFAWMHGFAFYFMPAALPFFVTNTLALGLACGYLTVKSDSLWGAVIIHAASDFFLFIAVLANA
ncbi:MAG: CPBP family intramembrane metalloprotease, partial [Anaerolineales bacterium]|nr:CPBP family intramembrane metalloprotease [Anaerolineales bacterium]